MKLGTTFVVGGHAYAFSAEETRQLGTYLVQVGGDALAARISAGHVQRYELNADEAMQVLQAIDRVWFAEVGTELPEAVNELRLALHAELHP